MNTNERHCQTDEQATWHAFVRETGEVMFKGSFDACQRFWRTGKVHLVIRRADDKPRRRPIQVPA